MEPSNITPEPDETEREAILRALAAEAAERPSVSAWTEAILPSRGGEEPEPYSQHAAGSAGADVGPDPPRYSGWARLRRRGALRA